jgi:hypothetical protein
VRCPCYYLKFLIEKLKIGVTWKKINVLHFATKFLHPKDPVWKKKKVHSKVGRDTRPVKFSLKNTQYYLGTAYLTGSPLSPNMMGAKKYSIYESVLVNWNARFSFLLTVNSSCLCIRVGENTETQFGSWV